MGLMKKNKGQDNGKQRKALENQLEDIIKSLMAIKEVTPKVLVETVLDMIVLDSQRYTVLIENTSRSSNVDPVILPNNWKTVNQALNQLRAFIASNPQFVPAKPKQPVRGRPK